jgi:hypothetical protein
MRPDGVPQPLAQLRGQRGLVLAAQSSAAATDGVA